MNEERADRRPRVLTDGDIEAIADMLEERLAERFYRNLGRGVWGLAKKGMLAALITLAAYGAFTHVGAPPK